MLYSVLVCGILSLNVTTRIIYVTFPKMFQRFSYYTSCNT